MNTSDVFNIDCMEYMRTLPDKAFQLAIADPPYGGAKETVGRTGGTWAAKYGTHINEWDKAPTQEWFDELNAEYSCRRERAGRIFDLLGAKYNPDTAGLFLWGRIDRKYATAAMTAGEALSERILHEAGVFITPGFIFGKNGQDYIRISLCAKPELLDKAFAKIEKAKDRIL